MDTNLRNSLSVFNPEHLSVFLEALVKLRGMAEDYMNGEEYDEGNFNTHDGICANCSALLWFDPDTWDTVADARPVLFRAWPEFSGCTVYPVPGLGYASTEVEEYNEELKDYEYRKLDPDAYAEADAEETFGNTTEMWDGEYGESRYRLLNFMIDTLTEFLTVKPKAATVTAANYKPAHGGYPGVVR